MRWRRCCKKRGGTKKQVVGGDKLKLGDRRHSYKSPGARPGSIIHSFSFLSKASISFTNSFNSLKRFGKNSSSNFPSYFIFSNLLNLLIFY